jgi:hypothetical protein
LQKITRELGLRADGLKGKLPANARKLTRARVALYKSWSANTDEGWTRWLLEQYEFPFMSITPADIRGGSLRARFDAIVIPSETRDQLTAAQIDMPPEYAGALGPEETNAIKAFVQDGGTLICLDRAAAFAISSFNLPVRDLAESVSSDTFFCPGSLLRLDLDPAEPMSYGLDAHAAGYFSFSSAFEVAAGSAGAHVAAQYAKNDLLVSGLLQGAQVIAGHAAVVDISVGSGRFVLLGFPVQHRGQTLATFRLLFNAIFTAHP